MMKYLRSIIVVVLITFYSCEEERSTVCQDVTDSTSINKILPIGASRVEGGRPDYESYRYELWKRLIDSGVDFDLVGSYCDEAMYPSYMDFSFDGNHEGIGGNTSGDILNRIDQWLPIVQEATHVLISSPGGNDALEGLDFQNALDNIHLIIDTMQAVNPSITILIEQLAPARSEAMTQDLTTFFNQMNSAVISLANQKSTPQSQVISVDMASGFNDSYYADDVHYNTEGAKEIARRYFSILQNVLL